MGWARDEVLKICGGGRRIETIYMKRVSRADEGPLRKKCYRHCKRSGRGSQKQNWLIFVSSFSFFFYLFVNGWKWGEERKEINRPMVDCDGGGGKVMQAWETMVWEVVGLTVE